MVYYTIILRMMILDSIPIYLINARDTVTPSLHTESQCAVSTMRYHYDDTVTPSLTYKKANVLFNYLRYQLFKLFILFYYHLPCRMGLLRSVAPLEDGFNPCIEFLSSTSPSFRHLNRYVAPLSPLSLVCGSPFLLW